MGVPEEDRPYIRDLSKKILLGAAEASGRTKLQAQGNVEMREYLGPLIEERLANPTDDLLSIVVSAEKSGQYNRDQVLGNAVLLLIAGHETTLNLVCNGTLAFIRNPDHGSCCVMTPQVWRGKPWRNHFATTRR